MKKIATKSFKTTKTAATPAAAVVKTVRKAPAKKAAAQTTRTTIVAKSMSGSATHFTFAVKVPD